MRWFSPATYATSETSLAHFHRGDDPDLRSTIAQHDWAIALIGGLVSAITLPLGALVGIYLKNYDQGVPALILAFGAGSLLFAVTVELYGEAVLELELHGYLQGFFEILSLAIGAMMGAGVYVLCTRWLDRVVRGPEAVRATGATPASDDSGSLESPEGARRSPGSLESGESARLLRPSEKLGMAITQDALRAIRGRKKAVLGSLEPMFVRYRRNKAWRRSRSSGQRTPLSPKSRERTPLPQRGSESSPYDGSLSPPSPPSPPESSNTETSWYDDLRIALFLWLGVLLDGIPESVLIGYMAAEGRLSVVIVIALMISNLPESLTSAMLLRKVGVASWKILTLWTVLFLGTGALASLTAWLLPDRMLNTHTKLPTDYRSEYWYLRLLGSLIEGFAGGAMLACIANVMLPEAYRKRGDVVGLVMLFGFLVAMLLKVFSGVLEAAYTGGIKKVDMWPRF